MTDNELLDRLIAGGFQVPDDRFLGNPVKDAIELAEAVLRENQPVWGISPVFRIAMDLLEVRQHLLGEWNRAEEPGSDCSADV